MGNVRVWTEQLFRKRGYIDEPWMRGVSRIGITAKELVQALNLAGKPGPDREFILMDETTPVAEKPEPRSELRWPGPIYTLAAPIVDATEFAITHADPPPVFCTGCGKRYGGFVVKRHGLMCDPCWETLEGTLRARMDVVKRLGPYCAENRGPNFLAIYFKGDVTIGSGVYLANTPAEAMAESIRVAIRNRWKLLRVDIQKTLTDIYRSRDYTKYFKVRDEGVLTYDEELYGPIPALWR